MPVADIPREVSRRTICGVNWPAAVTVACSDRVPVGRPSPLYVEAAWPDAGGELVLRLPEPDGEVAGQLRFAAPGDPRERRLRGDARRILQIEGVTASAGPPDVPLKLSIGDEEKTPFRLAVGAPSLTLAIEGGAPGADPPERLVPGEAVALRAAPAPAAGGGTFRWLALSPVLEIVEGERAQRVRVRARRSSPEPVTLGALFQAAGGATALTVHALSARTLEEMLEGGVLLPRHLEDPEFRARLESMRPPEVERLLERNRQNGDPALQGYLERLLAFVEEQEPLRAAPAGDREAITFLMGADPPGATNRFYTSAENFFTLHPEGPLVTHLRSLAEVRDHLAGNRPGNGRPWGEVNLVSHADELGGMQFPVVGGGRDVSLFSLREAIDEGQLDPLPDAVLDARSVIRIRGCAAGRSQAVLTRLSEALGGAGDRRRPVVRAPRHLQAYGFEFALATGALTGAEEYFVEFFHVGYPQGAVPPDPQVVRDLQAAHGGVLNWAQALRNAPPAGGLTPSTAPFHERRTREVRWEDPLWRVPANQADLDVILANTFDDFPTWQNVRETGRRPNPDGTTTVEIAFDTADGNPATTEIRVGRPGVGNAARRAAWFADQDQLHALLAAVDLEVDDFQWVFADEVEPLPGGGDRPVLVATGRRRIVRAQRELTEPDPANPAQVRRRKPPPTDLAHFGEEVPVRPPARPLGENVLP